MLGVGTVLLEQVEPQTAEFCFCVEFLDLWVMNCRKQLTRSFMISPWTTQKYGLDQRKLIWRILRLACCGWYKTWLEMF